MKVIGHRGARGLAPENTLEALVKGLEHKVDGLEFDLRVTKDNVVVLHHDKRIKVPDGRLIKISDYSYRELREHKKDLIDLISVLNSIGNKVPLYMEVKAKEPTKPIVEVIESFIDKGWKPEDFFLGSKSQKTLLLLHQALPEVPKFVIESLSGIRAHYRARQLNTKILFMYQGWLWSYFIKATSSRGYKLYAYTLNDKKKALRWKAYGLYGIVTDYPDQFNNQQ